MVLLKSLRSRAASRATGAPGRPSWYDTVELELYLRLSLVRNLDYHEA